MNLKITGLNFDVTEAIKQYVSGKLERINRHASNLISVTVTLSVDKLETRFRGRKAKPNIAASRPSRLRQTRPPAG